MVGPIKNQPLLPTHTSSKKKVTKEVDQRIKKAVKKSKVPLPAKGISQTKVSQEIATKQALLTAEKAAYAARLKAFETKEAALKAQKAAFLAQRAHMAQQAAAAKRALAAEKAKKTAKKAAQKASTLRRVLKVKAYLAKSEEKKQGRLLKKYMPSSQKKKNPSTD